MRDPGAVGPPTEKTLSNIRQARAHAFYWRGKLIQWQAKTQGCLLPHKVDMLGYHVWPHWDSRETEFWNQGRVRWTRLYWFTFGVSVVTPLPERRTNNSIIFGGEQRRQGDGISKAYTGRANGD